MRFGIFYEHQHPKPWREGAEQQLFQDALDQVELADQLGIDHAWEVEHHFLDEWEYSSRKWRSTSQAWPMPSWSANST